LNFGAAPWFQVLMTERRFNVGLPYLGPISGKWVSVISLPIWNERHEMVGAVQLPLDLAAFDPNIPAQFLPADNSYGFVSQDGTLIWRNRDPHRVTGTRPNSDAARRTVEVRDGEFESLAADGVRRFYSVVPMRETVGRRLTRHPLAGRALYRGRLASFRHCAYTGTLLISGRSRCDACQSR
jgi:hypothetical protein